MKIKRVKPANSGQKLLFGEKTVNITLRVPESKKEEIKSKFVSILNDYKK